MASETTTPAPASKWSDAEKIALLVSVIKTSGTKAKWSDVAVPAGRTSQSSAKIYEGLLKSAAAIPMTGGADITPSKKRGRKNNDDGAASPAEKKKCVRKPKAVARAAAPSPNGDDEEESPSKKIKVEAKEEDEEDGMSGDDLGLGDDAAA
ncbi:hypothetical protein IMSHALPRED_008787 [Imshaugia aleurites]|uniref:Myb-like domain-containing protein n=1 Tax=Imshaugia aleurites TaxID=172621 RepID=A0A8H3FW74_9LECA|nr:hypothetical protein IMSHALPRED_008787 [Imshaugia aleurites]